MSACLFLTALPVSSRRHHRDTVSVRWATDQLFCLLESPLGLADGGLSRLTAQLGYLVQLLLQVCLYEPELGRVALEELRPGVGVEGIRHDGGVRRVRKRQRSGRGEPVCWSGGSVGASQARGVVFSRAEGGEQGWQVVVVEMDEANRGRVLPGGVDVENGCYALDYCLVAGWGSRSGECVSSESPRALMARSGGGGSLVGASPGLG